MGQVAGNNYFMTRTMPRNFTLSASQKSQFERDGFLAVKDIFSAAEISDLRDHFMRLHTQAQDENAPVRAHYQPVSLEASRGDKLKQFPRVMHPARFDELSKSFQLDARVGVILRELFGEEPLAAQSMLYFKPPGAKGQALHQDNFYLNVSPGTCIAAWLSLDAADEENGGMFMVPGSHNLPILCPHLADMKKSFTPVEVAIPCGLQATPVPLDAGDVLFFNGSVIHGSFPNVSQNRFRRSFICHYVGDSTRSMNGGYYPLTTFTGETLERERSVGGSHTCGADEWDDFQDSIRRYELENQIQSGLGAH